MSKYSHQQKNKTNAPKRKANASGTSFISYVRRNLNRTCMIPTREQIDKKYHYKIYILESPSTKDISENRREGDSLFSALKLCEINSDYLLINSIDSLIDATNKIAADVNKRQYGKIPVPYIHLSLHGNEDGVGLSNGNIVTWKDLRIILMKMNHKVKFCKYDDKTVSRFSLSMSACKGIHAYNMFRTNEELNPFWTLVGPISDIEWADSLIAFIVYYHSLLYKRSFITEAVKRMNLSIGSDIFKNFLDIRFNHFTLEEK